MQDDEIDYSAITAIPTMYLGTKFRSRLEARWAAFFDLVGWRWEYEPVDLCGWVPDFVLIGANGTPCYVEIKPIFEPHLPTMHKMVEAAPDVAYMMLLGASLGKFIKTGRNQKGQTLGYFLFGWSRINELQLPHAPEDASNDWTEGRLGIRDDRCDVFSSRRPPWKLLFGLVGPHDFFVLDHEVRCIEAFWREAGNRVQWRARGN
jgi:hypothetical protein